MCLSFYEIASLLKAGEVLSCMCYKAKICRWFNWNLGFGDAWRYRKWKLEVVVL